MDYTKKYTVEDIVGKREEGRVTINVFYDHNTWSSECIRENIDEELLLIVLSSVLESTAEALIAEHSCSNGYDCDGQIFAKQLKSFLDLHKPYEDKES